MKSQATSSLLLSLSRFTSGSNRHPLSRLTSDLPDHERSHVLLALLHTILRPLVRKTSLLSPCRFSFFVAQPLSPLPFSTGLNLAPTRLCPSSTSSKTAPINHVPFPQDTLHVHAHRDLHHLDLPSRLRPLLTILPISRPSASLNTPAATYMRRPKRRLRWGADAEQHPILWSVSTSTCSRRARRPTTWFVCRDARATGTN